MKSVKFLTSLISFTILVPALLIPCNAQAADFYAWSGWYEPLEKLTKVEGRFVTVLAEGKGMAGIEQDVIFEGPDGQLTVEMVNWYRGMVPYYTCAPDSRFYTAYGPGPLFEVGIVVYLNGETASWSYYPTAERQHFTYTVSIEGDCIYAEIRDKDDRIAVSETIDYFPCETISYATCYLEYWEANPCCKYQSEGPFFYYGYLTIENANQYNLDNKLEGGHSKQEDAFTVRSWFHNWDNTIFEKYEIDKP
jgi:hypothetical protein